MRVAGMTVGVTGIMMVVVVMTVVMVGMTVGVGDDAGSGI